MCKFCRASNGIKSLAPIIRKHQQHLQANATGKKTALIRFPGNTKKHKNHTYAFPSHTSLEKQTQSRYHAYGEISNGNRSAFPCFLGNTWTLSTVFEFGPWKRKHKTDIFAFPPTHSSIFENICPFAGMFCGNTVTFVIMCKIFLETHVRLGLESYRVETYVRFQGKCTTFQPSSAAIPWYRSPPPSSTAHPSSIKENCENPALLLDAARFPCFLYVWAASQAWSHKTDT